MTRSGVAGRPLDHIVTGAWPDVTAVDCAAAAAAVDLAAQLRSALGERSLREVARAAGVSHSTVLGVLNGSSWPGIALVAELSAALEADLWPHPGRYGQLVVERR